jgi:oligosaccharide repeat unit polymerase
MTVLMGILLFTSVAAYMVGRQPGWDFSTVIYTIYIAILLYILFRGFRNYSDVNKIETGSINLSRLSLVENVTTFLGILVIIVYAYILSQILPMLIMGTIAVQEYKNEGGAADVWETMVPHSLITIGNFVAPLGYFFLSLHFYYLVKRNFKKAIKYFLLSFCLVLNGLVALSRSVSAQYIILYVTVLFFLLPLLSKKMKKGVAIVAIVMLGAIVVGLGVISDSRFSDYYTKDSKNEAILDETEQTTLFSALDYFAQWEENAPIILERHKFEYNSWGLYNCSGLALMIQKKLYGGEKINNERLAKYDRILGEQKSRFHGIVARLVYDFGFLGTILFIILYSNMIFRLGPQKGTVTFKTLVSLTLLLPPCVVFWAGNEFISLNLDLAIIYSLIIYKFVSKSPKQKKLMENITTS